MASLVVTQKDYSNETTRTNFRIPDIGADAGEDAAIATAGSELQAGVVAVTNGQVQSYKFAQDPVRISSAAATLEDAQRERKAVIYFEDNVSFEPGSLEIGCIDVTKVTVNPGTDVIDLAAGGMAQLVTAIETHHLSKAGNAVTVTRAELVGRNL